MKGIVLVLTLLIGVTSAAIAGDKHDRNAAPRHRSPYMAPTKTVTKPQSVNDQLSKLERETAKTPGPAKKTAPGAVVPKPSATVGIRAPAIGGGVPVEEYLFYLMGFIAVLLMYIWLDEKSGMGRGY